MSMDIQDAAELLHTFCKDSADLLLPCCRGATEIKLLIGSLRVLQTFCRAAADQL